MGVDARILVRVPRDVKPSEVDDLAYRLAEAFWHDTFSTVQPGTYSWIPNGCRSLERVDVYQQDGDDILPQNGETLLEVHLGGRYYGPGYERGPLWTYVAIAYWLELNIPGCAVWYGGDSSGICAEPFGPEERKAMMAHFADVGHEPYAGAWNTGDTPLRAPMCALCKRPMRQFTWGGGIDSERAGYQCAGCGLKRETDDGVTFHAPKEDS
jgi:hypothetical protein